MKYVIIAVIIVTICLIGYGAYTERMIKVNFCKDNPNANLISADDYNQYGNWFVSGNDEKNISEKINCDKYMLNSLHNKEDL